MSLIGTLCLTLAMASPQTVKSWDVDQALFGFRTGLDHPDLLSRAQALAKTSRGADQQKSVFLVGRLFQRNYEKPFMSGSKSADKKILKSAYNQYRDYLAKWGRASSEWLSDVRFYKAFFFLENNQLDQSLVALRDLRPELDPIIFVDDIVWTENRTYSVLQSYEAGKLRDVLVDLIKRHRGDKVLDLRVQSIATELRTWCRINRYGKSAG